MQYINTKNMHNTQQQNKLDTYSPIGKKITKINKELQAKYSQYKKQHLSIDVNMKGGILTEHIPNIAKIDKYLGQGVQGQHLLQFQQSYRLHKSQMQCQSDRIRKQKQIMELVHVDSALFQYSQQLRIKAQQQQKQLVIDRFPLRYQDLLNKQQQLNSLQDRHCQQQNKLKAQIESQSKKLSHITCQLAQKVKQLQQQTDRNRKQEQQYECQLKQCLIRKDHQLRTSKDEIQNIKSRLSKVKVDYTNASKVVTELRENQTQLNKQNQRLIARLKDTQSKVEKAHKKILYLQEQLKNMKLALQNQINLQAEAYKQKISLQQEQINNLQQRLQFKQSLIEMSDRERDNIIDNFQQQQKQKHEQIQQIRQQYLQALKAMDQFEIKLQQNNNRSERNGKIAQLQISKLKKQLDDKYLIIGEYKLNIDGKQNYIYTLQQKVQSVIIKYTNQLDRLNTQNKKQNSELADKFRQQYDKLIQANRILLQQKQSMLTKLVQIQQQNNADFSKIEEVVVMECRQHLSDKQAIQNKYNEISQLNVYLVSDNTRLINVLKQKQKECEKLEQLNYQKQAQTQAHKQVQTQTQTQTHKQVQTQVQAKVQVYGSSGQTCEQTQHRLNEYAKIVQKLEHRLVEMAVSNQNKSDKTVNMYRQLLAENRKLKKQGLLCTCN